MLILPRASTLFPCSTVLTLYRGDRHREVGERQLLLKSFNTTSRILEQLLQAMETQQSVAQQPDSGEKTRASRPKRK